MACFGQPLVPRKDETGNRRWAGEETRDIDLIFIANGHYSLNNIYYGQGPSDDRLSIMIETRKLQENIEDICKKLKKTDRSFRGQTSTSEGPTQAFLWSHWRLRIRWTRMHWGKCGLLLYLHVYRG